MDFEIEAPAKFHHETSMKIRINDINYGGHLSNDAVLAIAHEARIQFLASHGWTELDIGGVGIIMKNAAIDFISQGRHADSIVVRTALTQVERFNFTLTQELAKSDKSETIAMVETRFFCFDYQTQKIRSVPPEFKKLTAKS